MIGVRVFLFLSLFSGDIGSLKVKTLSEVIEKKRLLDLPSGLNRIRVV